MFMPQFTSRGPSFLSIKPLYFKRTTKYYHTPIANASILFLFIDIISGIFLTLLSCALVLKMLNSGTFSLW